MLVIKKKVNKFWNFGFRNNNNLNLQNKSDTGSN